MWVFIIQLKTTLFYIITLFYAILFIYYFVTLDNISIPLSFKKIIIGKILVEKYKRISQQVLTLFKNRTCFTIA